MFAGRRPAFHSPHVNGPYNFCNRAPFAILYGHVKLFIDDAANLPVALSAVTNHANANAPGRLANAVASAQEMLNAACDTPYDNLGPALSSNRANVSARTRNWVTKLNDASKFLRHNSETKARSRLGQMHYELMVANASLYDAKRRVTMPRGKHIGTCLPRSFSRRPPGTWSLVADNAAVSGDSQDYNDPLKDDEFYCWHHRDVIKVTKISWAEQDTGTWSLVRDNAAVVVGDSQDFNDPLKDDEFHCWHLRDAIKVTKISWADQDTVVAATSPATVSEDRPTPSTMSPLLLPEIPPFPVLVDPAAPLALPEVSTDFAPRFEPAAGTIAMVREPPPDCSVPAMTEINLEALLSAVVNGDDLALEEVPNTVGLEPVSQGKLRKLRDYLAMEVTSRNGIDMFTAGLDGVAELLRAAVGDYALVQEMDRDDYFDKKRTNETLRKMRDDLEHLQRHDADEFVRVQAATCKFGVLNMRSF